MQKAVAEAFLTASISRDYCVQQVALEHKKKLPLWLFRRHQSHIPFRETLFLSMINISDHGRRQRGAESAAAPPCAETNFLRGF